MQGLIYKMYPIIKFVEGNKKKELIENFQMIDLSHSNTINYL